MADQPEQGSTVEDDNKSTKSGPKSQAGSISCAGPQVSNILYDACILALYFINKLFICVVVMFSLSYPNFHQTLDLVFLIDLPLNILTKFIVINHHFVRKILNTCIILAIKFKNIFLCHYVKLYLLLREITKV